MYDTLTFLDVSVCKEPCLYMGFVRKEMILVRTLTLERVASALKNMHERKA